MKFCSRCSEEKDKSLFSKCSRSKDGLFAWCKPCMANYEKERYHKGDKERKKRNRKSLQDKARRFIWDYLSERPCIDCGESDPELLDFDHRDPKEKTRNVTEMFDFSISNIKKEIAKCDVRCCKCHRKRTNRQFGFWRGVMS